MNELQGVKAGDILVARERGGIAGSFYKVERTTATRAICERGIAFRIKDGGRVGETNSWGGTYVKKAEQKDFDQRAMRPRIYKAQSAIDALRVTDANVTDVEALLLKLTTPKEPS